MEPLKINIGCGDTSLAGWENIDNSLAIVVAKRPWTGKLLSAAGIVQKSWWDKWVGRDVKWVDVRKGLPFPDSSAQGIYTCHLLEHFTPKDSEHLLLECRRVLRPGGILRIVTPDLEKLFDLYQTVKKNFDRDKADLERVPADFFLSCTGIFPGIYTPSDKGLIGYLLKNSKHYHRWLYDFDSLYVLLKRIGYKDIERLSALKGKIIDLEFLEKHLVLADCLFVEATI